MLPVPQVGSKQKRKTNKKKGKAAILTSSPYKQELQEGIDKAKKKKEEKEERARKKLDFSGSKKKSTLKKTVVHAKKRKINNSRYEVIVTNVILILG